MAKRPPKEENETFLTIINIGVSKNVYLYKLGVIRLLGALLLGVIKGFQSFGGFSAGAKFNAVFLSAIRRFLLVSSPSTVSATK